MRVLIVDDEPIAQNILQKYVLNIPHLELIDKCSDALEAFSMLSKQPVDLMLLDINMPEISGIDFIKTIKNPPLIIFTTAYSEFAVESYDLNAIDYLLKPVSFDRFLKAIDKANVVFRQMSSKMQSAASNNADELLFVKSEGKLVKIDLAQLWLVESLGDYICLYAGDKKILVLSTLQYFEEQISGNALFVRVNRSYIVNIKYVSEIDGNAIQLNGRSITIGNTYRSIVHNVFEKLKLL